MYFCCGRNGGTSSFWTHICYRHFYSKDSHSGIALAPRVSYLIICVARILSNVLGLIFSAVLAQPSYLLAVLYPPSSSPPTLFLRAPFPLPPWASFCCHLARRTRAPPPAAGPLPLDPRANRAWRECRRPPLLSGARAGAAGAAVPRACRRRRRPACRRLQRRRKCAPDDGKTAAARAVLAGPSAAALCACLYLAAPVAPSWEGGDLPPPIARLCRRRGGQERGCGPRRRRPIFVSPPA